MACLEEIPVSATTPTIQVAKKQHRCSWCAEMIEPGDTYSRWRYFSEDGQATVKMHHECERASLRELRGGGENEWEMHQRTKGMTMGETDAFDAQLDELLSESPTEAAARVLGARLAADLDAAVLRGLRHVHGVFPALDELTPGWLATLNLVRQVMPNGIEQWWTAGQLIVKAEPIKVQMARGRMVATRNVWCIADKEAMFTEPLPDGFVASEQSLAAASALPSATGATSSH